MATTPPGRRRTTLMLYLSAYDPSVAAPGNATVNTCRILVPFKHILRRAWLTCTDIDNVGAVTAELRQADDGDAKAGTIVGTALSDTQLAATADLITVLEFTLAAADKVSAPANRVYHVALIGTNAGDLIEQPTLDIEVQPIPRIAL